LKYRYPERGLLRRLLRFCRVGCESWLRNFICEAFKCRKIKSLSTNISVNADDPGSGQENEADQFYIKKVNTVYPSGDCMIDELLTRIPRPLSICMLPQVCSNAPFKRTKVAIGEIALAFLINALWLWSDASAQTVPGRVR